MAEESDKSDKTEPPSPFKLREAQKKGQVYKSQEVNSVMALSLIFILLIVAGASFMSDVFALCASILQQIAEVSFNKDTLALFFKELAIRLAYVVSPIVLVMMLGGVISTILQTGLVFTAFPLKPDIKRINPVSGLKKLFSMKTIFEFLKTLFKVAAFSLVLFISLNATVPEVLSLSQRAVQTLIPFFVNHAAWIIFQLLCVIALIALLDFLFVRWEYMKNMRMTKKEVKDEYKRREGDPKIKQKRKEIQRELMKKAQSMSSVSDADMLITNPTHFAVALQYLPEKMFAPQVVAKGRDISAKRIREEARKHNIPIFEMPALSRQIYRESDIGHGIPLVCYLSVARLYRKLHHKNLKTQEGSL